MATYREGEVVEVNVDGSGERGVVTGVFEQPVNWPTGDDGEDETIQGTPENPVYIISLVSGGSRAYREDEMKSSQFDEEMPDVEDAVEDIEMSSLEIVPGDGREGSDKNDDGSASDKENDIDFSDSIIEGLKNKVEEHNEEYGDEPGKRVTLDMLKAVFRRGAGAYSDSHREGISRNQWAYARVDAFLYLVRNGEPENENYTQDNDLLPEDHPRYTGSDVTDASWYGWYDHVDDVEELAAVKSELEKRLRANNVATLSRTRGTSEMTYDELIDVPGVDDPGVGWDEYPDSWEESEQPNRLILLKAWSSMGGTWRGCFREMTTNMTPRRARKLCSSMKDEVYGTEEWRGFA